MEDRINKIMLELENKDKIYDHQTRELFAIYNELFPDIKEFGIGCSACRERVYNTVKSYWVKTKTK